MVLPSKKISSNKDSSTPAYICGRKFLKNIWNEPVKENTASICYRRSNSIWFWEAWQLPNT